MPNHTPKPPTDYCYTMVFTYSEQTLVLMLCLSLK